MTATESTPLAFQDILTWLKSSYGAQQIIKLPGDASTRQYFRMLGNGGKSYVVMKMEPFPESGMPFLVVQKHLIEAQIDVPRVLEQNPTAGMLLLEDLGDVTLLRRLQEVSNQDLERQIYERVIDSLVDLQWKASPERKPASIEAYQLRFDTEKLQWEVEFTIEHFYQKFLGRAISEADLKVMRGFFEEICTFLARQPVVLTHRDFHSRNVMVIKGEPERYVMIDFQDARLGPAQYDLASLLKDSYYQLEETQVDRLLGYYIERWEAVSGETVDRSRFRHVFDLMSVQRNFKAIGSFASFLNRRGNPHYLKFIGNTFENIRRTLLKYPRYSDLREILFHYYYF